uniref:Uncharacterized protein n=1 Tax=Echinococcus granulosus TaxID=6210 RepID=A0A068WX67_ECHGR|nr:hypothetical protein EgrG_002035200 [Echinococcus granulosus]
MSAVLHVLLQHSEPSLKTRVNVTPWYGPVVSPPGEGTMAKARSSLLPKSGVGRPTYYIFVGLLLPVPQPCIPTVTIVLCGGGGITIFEQPNSKSDDLLCKGKSSLHGSVCDVLAFVRVIAPSANDNKVPRIDGPADRENDTVSVIRWAGSDLDTYCGPQISPSGLPANRILRIVRARVKTSRFDS